MKSSAGKVEPVLINMSMNTARDNDSLYPGIEEKTGKKLSFQQSIPSSIQLLKESTRCASMFDGTRHMQYGRSKDLFFSA